MSGEWLNALATVMAFLFIPGLLALSKLFARVQACEAKDISLDEQIKSLRATRDETGIQLITMNGKLTSMDTKLELLLAGRIKEA